MNVPKQCELDDLRETGRIWNVGDVSEIGNNVFYENHPFSRVTTNQSCVSLCVLGNLVLMGNKSQFLDLNVTQLSPTHESDGTSSVSAVFSLVGRDVFASLSVWLQCLTLQHSCHCTGFHSDVSSNRLQSLSVYTAIVFPAVNFTILKMVSLTCMGIVYFKKKL